MFRRPKKLTLLDSVTADGWSSGISVTDYSDILITIGTSNSADGDIKVGLSELESANVDFTSAASETNRWDYCALWNQNNPTTIIAGDTGVQYTGTDSVERILVNTKGATTLSVELDNYVAGNFTVTMFAITNQ